MMASYLVLALFVIPLLWLAYRLVPPVYDVLCDLWRVISRGLNPRRGTLDGEEEA